MYKELSVNLQIYLIDNEGKTKQEMEDEFNKRFNEFTKSYDMDYQIYKMDCRDDKGNILK